MKSLNSGFKNEKQKEVNLRKTDFPFMARNGSRLKQRNTKENTRNWLNVERKETENKHHRNFKS